MRKSCASFLCKYRQIYIILFIIISLLGRVILPKRNSKQIVKACRLCFQGNSDQNIAKILNVHKTTINYMKNRYIQIHILLICGLITLCVLTGCDINDPLSLDSEMLDVDLASASNSINIGDTTTISATITYSGNTDVLVFKWSATGGRISGEGANVVYIAPETEGSYTITLEVSDGTVTEKDELRITVNIGHAIVATPNRYWQGNSFTQSLTFQLNVQQVIQNNLRLRYDILQDTARTGAFLSISINGASVVRNRAIGEVQPLEMIPIADEVDVSSVIREPGNYELTLTLEVVNVMEDAWLLRKIMLIGAEGTITEIR